MSSKEIEIAYMLLGVLMVILGLIGFRGMVKKNKASLIPLLVCSALVLAGSFLFFYELPYVKEQFITPSPTPPVSPDSVIGFLQNIISK